MIKGIVDGVLKLSHGRLAIEPRGDPSLVDADGRGKEVIANALRFIPMLDDPARLVETQLGAAGPLLIEADETIFALEREHAVLARSTGFVLETLADQMEHDRSETLALEQFGDGKVVDLPGIRRVLDENEYSCDFLALVHIVAGKHKEAVQSTRDHLVNHLLGIFLGATEVRTEHIQRFLQEGWVGREGIHLV